MPGTYIDPLLYQRAPTGVESASLVANLVRLNTLHVAGATTLAVSPALSASLSQYNNIYVFDGPNSEIVQVGSAGASSGATSIPLQGTGLQYQHNAGTLICADGTYGSLAAMIFSASATLETITKQPLWQTTQNETLRMPSIRASLDNQFALTFKPRQYPITALTSVAIQTFQGVSIQYDPSYATIAGDRETITMSALVTLSGSDTSTTYFYAQPLTRTTNAWLLYTYTAGYAQGALPHDVELACTYLVSDLLGLRDNPTGAAQLVIGKRNLVSALRGDTSGESLLYKSAIKILSNYMVRPY